MHVQEAFLKALPCRLDIKRHSPCILYIYVLYFQTEEEREWFAQRFESKDKIDISNGRKISLATLLLRAEVRGVSYFYFSKMINNVCTQWNHLSAMLLTCIKGNSNPNDKYVLSERAL